MSVDVFIIAGVAVTQIVTSWYGVHVSIKKHRMRTGAIIATVGACGLALTVWGALRSESAQTDLKNQVRDIETKMDTEKRPSVDLNTMQWWPNQLLVPDVNLDIQLGYTVTVATAKNYRQFEEAFSLPGKSSANLDRQALDKFRHDSAGKLDYQGQDILPGNGGIRTLKIRFSKSPTISLRPFSMFLFLHL